MTTELISPEFIALQSALAGRYSLVRELGRGGMGVVFLAREVALDRLVAIKLLPPSLSNDPVRRERFVHEARTAAGLAHPNIVPIHAVDASGALAWFAMEYVPGETLGARLQRDGSLPIAPALRIIRESAWALAHAHARGVVHRDIKPDNILLEESSNRAVVTDFGIARSVSGDDAAAGHGTPHYMSPEQAFGQVLDARADVYGLGVLAWHALSGRRPFEGTQGAALLAAQSGGDPPSILSVMPRLPVELAAAIDRAVQRDPDARWDSMESFARGLDTAHSLQPQLPIPLRRFARHALAHSERLGVVISASASALATAIAIDAFVADNFFGLQLLPYLVVASLGVSTAILMLGAHINEIRKLASAGYSRQNALRAITELEVDEPRETFKPSLNPMWNHRAGVIHNGLLAAIVGIYLSVNATGFLILAPAMLLVLLAPALAARRVAELRGVRGSWWRKVLNSRIGRRIWQVATLGLRPAPEAAIGGEPTAMVVGGAVQALYQSLPMSEQRLLSAVPSLIVELEAKAMDRGSPNAVSAMAALDTLRMDLMRLRAGQLKAEGITEELSKLRDVGFYVDAKAEV